MVEDQEITGVSRHSIGAVLAIRIENNIYTHFD